MYRIFFSVIKLIMITPVVIYLLSIFITEFGCSIYSCNLPNGDFWQIPVAVAPIVIPVAIASCLIGYRFRKGHAMAAAR